GTDHPSVLITKINIANSLVDSEQKEEAVVIYKQVLSKQLNVLGEEHPTLLITKQNLAVCLYKTGRIKEALEIFTEVEQVGTLDENHPILVNTKKFIEICLEDLRSSNKSVLKSRSVIA
uniref:Kinesin light chain n=1 Tax=Clytia hemisphaerica TaxID=252671 RepID=A0A7M5X1I4_9CNID